MTKTFMQTALFAGMLGLISPSAQAGSNTATPDWTGFYIGASLGAAAANTIATPAVAMPTGETLIGNSQTGSAFTVGAKAGFDKQIGSFVIGAFGEVDYLHIATRGIFAEGGDNSTWGTQVGDLLGSARVRIGATSENVMIYGSGGLAVAHSGVSGWFYETLLDGAGPMDFPNNRLGLVIGGGIEYRLNQTISVNLDYSHYLFSASNSVQEFSDENEGPTMGGTNRTGIDVMKVGLNYRF